MKHTLIFLFCLVTSFASIAQDRMDRNEKIKTLKVAFITEKLDLTKTEAEKFWPIYNDFDEKMHEFREKSAEKRKEKEPDSLTENEAKKLLDDMMKIDKQKNELHNQYINDLLKIIPATKVIKLFRAEHDFNRKMFEEFKKRRHERRDRP